MLKGQLLTGDKDSQTPPLVSLAAGGVAGGIEAFTSVRLANFYAYRRYKVLKLHEQYPMEFAKTRVQLRSEKGIPTPRNPFRVVTEVYRKEGVRAIYKGCAALVVVWFECLSSDRHFVSVRLLLSLGTTFPGVPDTWTETEHQHVH